MRASKKLQKRVAFGFGSLVGLFFALIQKGFLSWNPNPGGGLEVIDALLLAVGMFGIGVTVFDMLLGKESLPAWFEGLVSGFVTVVGFGDLVVSASLLH